MSNIENHQSGLFQVRVGPMFCGKTSRVIGHALNNEKRFQDVVNKEYIRILIVRPERDTAIDNPNILTTHGKHLTYDVSKHENVDIIVLPYGLEDQLSLKYAYYDMFIIDEGQFFSDRICIVLSRLSYLGKEIYYTALLHDFLDQPFPTTLAVMTITEVSNIKKLYNQCSKCGNKGFRSARLLDGVIQTRGDQELVNDKKAKDMGYEYIGICIYCKEEELGLK